MHLAFNGITLYSFGQVLETYLTAKYGLNLGEGVFWIFVITAMLASSMISFIRHKDNVGYKSLGFSGVTSAIVFGVILLAPDMKLMLMFIPVPIPAWLFGLIYLAFEIYADRNKKTNIAHDAHIAGAIYGIIFIFLTNIEEVMTNFRTLIG
jgi:membrane associated rhomboid family serine protease